ncbi:MAG TPA: FeoA family protein [Anaeromyxobacter sp.]|nr:FeoA family protein [Anaeromyxobacter sp.]
MLPLGLLNEGECGWIVSSGGQGCGSADERAASLGLRAGNRVMVLQNGAGPLLVKVDESRIALDRAIAMRIRVRKETR